MKPIASVGLFLGCALSALAQTVSYTGATTGSTMPGSSTDWIFFNAGDFNIGNEQNNAESGYEDLSSFSMSGGVSGGGYSNEYAITPPGGSSPVTTGVITAHPGIAFQLVLGTNPANNGADSNTSLNPNFNYNDFNVWVMVSNTNGNFTDTNVSLTPYFPTQGSNPDDSSTVWGTNTVDITDNSTSVGNAMFLEFHVSGMEAASIADGVPIDLAMTANYASNGSPSGTAYIGGVSFQSVPEPSTWAMALAGLGTLGLAWRLRRVSSRV